VNESAGAPGGAAAPGPADEAAALARRCAAAMYADDRASQHAGITIHDVGPGRATARMTVTDTMINGHDICHGGYVVMLADTAFAFACNTYNRRTVAAGADVTFVAPARRGDILEARAVERTRRGRSGLYDVTVRRAGPAPLGGPGSDTGRPDAGSHPAVSTDVADAGEVVAEFRGRSREIPGTLV
jgi:phenylacetic acid degradation protein PaaD